MATATDTTGAGAPFVKFRSIGDTLIGAFAGSVQRQQREYKQDGSQGELLWKPKKNETEQAKPLLEEIMYFVAVGPACSVVTGKEDEGYNAIQDKAVVRFGVKSFKWGQAIEAAKTLPAFRDDFRKGQRITGDMWKIVLTGFSAQSPGPAATEVYVQAGLTVVEGRVVMRTAEEHMRWVQIQASRRLNTNAAADYEMICRRTLPEERAYEDAADTVYASKPWDRAEPEADSVVAQQGAPQKGADPWGSPSQEPAQQAQQGFSPEAQAMQEAARQALQPGPASVPAGPPAGPPAGDPWAQPAAPAAAPAPAGPPAAAFVTQGDPWAAPAQPQVAPTAVGPAPSGVPADPWAAPAQPAAPAAPPAGADQVYAEPPFSGGF